MAVKFQQLSAWSTGPGVSVQRRGNSGGGSFSIRDSNFCYNQYGLTGNKDSALLFGGTGYSGTSGTGIDATEEYDGGTWATSNTLPFKTTMINGVGSQNATLATAFGSCATIGFGLSMNTACSDTGGPSEGQTSHISMVNNHCTPAATTTRFMGDASLEYNGTSWDATATDIAAADDTRCQNLNAGAVGEMTNALIFGGGNFCIVTPNSVANSPGYASTTQDRIYNGTSWSVTGNTLNTNRFTGQYFGTAEAAVYAGGHRDLGAPNYSNTLFDIGNSQSCVEEYNGTSWSVVNNMLFPRHDGGGAGTQNDGVVFGGHNVRISSACPGNGDNDEAVSNLGGLCEDVSSYYGLYTMHYDGISWKNASGLMNNHRWGMRGTGGNQGTALGGVGQGRMSTNVATNPTRGDCTGRSSDCVTTNAWYNEFADFNMAHEGPSSYGSGGTVHVNSIEEYSVTTGGAQFGPRISGFQLTSLWDAGNYKSFFSRDEGNNCTDGILGKLGTNECVADFLTYPTQYSGSSAGTDYGQYQAGTGQEGKSAGAGLFGTGYESGSIQFKGWSIGPDFPGSTTSNCTKSRGLMGAGKQDDMIMVGGFRAPGSVGDSGNVMATTKIYDGTNWAEGPDMHRAISHGAAAGKDSKNVIAVGSLYTSLKGAVAPGGCGHTSKSVRQDDVYGIQGESHFLGHSLTSDPESFIVTCAAAGCHRGATPGDVNVSAPTLNDWTGDKGGYNTPFRNPSFPTLPDACIHMMNQTSHLDGTTWSDGGALPMGTFGTMRSAAIASSGPGCIGERTTPKLAAGMGADHAEEIIDSHVFIGARFTVGGPSNALFICDSAGQTSIDGPSCYLASPYLRGDKAVKYNGTTWSDVNSPLHSGLFRGNAMAGNPESAIRVIGSSPVSPTGAVNDCKVEEYDGNVWSQLPNQLLPRNYAGWTGNNSLAGHIWGGSGKALFGADHYGRSDSWDGNAWASSCAMTQHIPQEIAEGSGLGCSGICFGDSQEIECGRTEEGTARPQITLAGLGTNTGTRDNCFFHSGLEGTPNLTPPNAPGMSESIFADGVGTTNSAYAATGFVIPALKPASIGIGGAPEGEGAGAPINGQMQTAFWNDVSLRDVRNNYHFNLTGSSFQPKDAIANCTKITEYSETVTFGTAYGTEFSDARINTSFQDKNHYVELNGSGSMESDYYLSSDSTFHTAGETGFENCTFPRVWSMENGLSQPRIMMDGAGTPEGAIVAGGQSCSPSNASVSTFNCAELWDGIQFSAAPANLPASTRRHVTLGSKNHAHVFAGYCPGSNPASTNLQDNIQEYLNGTWSNLSATLATPRADAMGAGKAGGWVLWGGTTVGCTNDTYGGNLTDDVVIYNGDTISAGPATPTVVGHQGAAGSSNAAIGVGGVIASDNSIQPVTDTTDTTIKFDGTSWSAGPNQLADSHFQAGAGTQNSSTFWGGTNESANGAAVSVNLSSTCAITQEFDGTAFTQGGRIPRLTCTVDGVGQTCRAISSDGFGNIGSSVMATGAYGQSSAGTSGAFIYGNYKGLNNVNRIAADKHSGGLTISMWVRMPRTADSYSDTDPAWDNKLYLAANADVDIASPFIAATTDVPRAGVRLLRYYNGSGDQIRLEWQNKAVNNLGSGNYAWDSNGNQNIISYFQTTDNQTFVTTDWYNIVAVVSFERSDVTNKIFINGVKKTLTLSGQSASTYEDVRYPGNYTSRFRIGRFAGHKYELDVANVMYYTRQLGDDEVLQNYKTLLPRFI